MKNLKFFKKRFHIFFITKVNTANIEKWSFIKKHIIFFLFFKKEHLSEYPLTPINNEFFFEILVNNIHCFFYIISLLCVIAALSKIKSNLIPENL